MSRCAYLLIDVGDVEGRVSAREVDFNLVDPAVVFERHAIRVVFEDGRAAILADVERFVDRVDEGHRVADGGPGDFGAVHLEHVGAAFAEFALLAVVGEVDAHDMVAGRQLSGR